MSSDTDNKVTEDVVRDNMLHRKNKGRTHPALRSPRPTTPRWYPATKENTR